MTNQQGWTEDPSAKVFPETHPFWAAAAKGVFLVPKCDSCGKSHWHPRAHCPFCYSAALQWIEASGRGEVHSCSVVRRKDDPYVLAYVRIEEGPLVMTNVVAPKLEDVRIGMKVKVAFRQEPGGRHVPLFALS